MNKILIVEDEYRIRELLCDYFEAAGYEVLQAYMNSISSLMSLVKETILKYPYLVPLKTSKAIPS